MNEEKAILEHIKKTLEFCEDNEPYPGNLTNDDYERLLELNEKALAYIQFKLNILNLFLL